MSKNISNTEARRSAVRGFLSGTTILCVMMFVTCTESSNVPSLPQGWTSDVDPSSGRTYYISPIGDTQWDHPVLTKFGWRSEYQNGQMYYIDPQGESQWEFPVLPGWKRNSNSDGIHGKRKEVQIHGTHEECQQQMASKFLEENDCADCGLPIKGAWCVTAKPRAIGKDGWKSLWAVFVCSNCIDGHRDDRDKIEYQSFTLDELSNLDNIVSCFEKGKGNDYVNKEMDGETIRKCIAVNPNERKAWVMMKYGYGKFSGNLKSVIKGIAGNATKTSTNPNPKAIVATKYKAPNNSVKDAKKVFFKGGNTGAKKAKFYKEGNKGAQKRYFILDEYAGKIKYYENESCADKKYKGEISSVKEIFSTNYDGKLAILVEGTTIREKRGTAKEKLFKIVFASEYDKYAFIMLASKMKVEGSKKEDGFSVLEHNLWKKSTL